MQIDILVPKLFLKVLFLKTKLILDGHYFAKHFKIKNNFQYSF